MSDESSSIKALGDLPEDKRTDVLQIVKDLDEWSIYFVHVALNKWNPIHEAVLLTGFKTGSYASLVHASYERQLQTGEAHYLRIVKHLGKFTTP